MPTGDGMPDLTREQVIERLQSAGSQNLQPYLELLCRSIWLRVDPTRAPSLMESRFGGPAMVPEDFVWPMYEAEPYLGSGTEDETFTVYYGERHKAPQFLIAQINLSEIPMDSPLPRTGLLSFFTDPFDGVWGGSLKDRDGFFIHYSPEERFASLRPREMPGRSGEGAFANWSWPCFAVRFFTKWTVSDWGAYHALVDAEPDRDVSVRMRDILNEIHGYPFGHFLLDAGRNHQNDPRESAVLACDQPEEPQDDASFEEVTRHYQEIERRASDWTTLLSITKDKYLRPVVDDTGGLSFMVRKADLAERRFDRGWIYRS